LLVEVYQRFVFMSRHTKSKAELEARFNVVLVKPAVVDEEVPGVVVSANDACAVIAGLFGDGVRELPAGRGNAVENISEAVSGFLAW
jgi:hypothetical protein